ncbi:leucyl/phenylalanyl-tRNA--protein transferase [Celeribacter sp.]|uniref:leucyl/phenylalanyl-tRNA--protein transferase n=1 Tax=Celeribacter sp. TaxID=1890673 RepID=UPI003A95AA17
MDTPDLTPELLLNAYANGVFPMAESAEDDEVFWVDPDRRGIFPLDQFHLSNSLARVIRRERFTVTFNHAFADVVRQCANREETWINTTIFDLYSQVHALGFAQSVEVWDGERLVGGLYGITLGAAFFGESMFSHKTDASKVALSYLIAHLKRTGFTLLDTQFITPHLASLGAIEIDRAEYHARLDAALERDADFREIAAPPSAQEVLQLRTQAS